MELQHLDKQDLQPPSAGDFDDYARDNHTWDQDDNLQWFAEDDLATVSYHRQCVVAYHSCT